METLMSNSRGGVRCFFFDSRHSSVFRRYAENTALMSFLAAAAPSKESFP